MKNFEENLRKLDEIIEFIDQGSALTASLELYKKGMELVADCAADLTAIEAQVKTLRVENGELKIEDFADRLSKETEEED